MAHFLSQIPRETLDKALKDAQSRRDFFKSQLIDAQDWVDELTEEADRRESLDL